MKHGTRNLDVLFLYLKSVRSKSWVGFGLLLGPLLTDGLVRGPPEDGLVGTADEASTKCS